MPDTASRLLRLLTLLQSRPRWTAAELADQLAVSTRTVRADVERVRGLGYDVDATTGTGGGYTLRPGGVLPPVSFTDDEALAIAVALQTVSASGLADAAEATASAAAKLDRLLPSHLRHQVATLSAVADTVDPARDPVPTDTFAAVARACREHATLRCTYRARDGAASERRVEPHRLVHVSGRWYLVGHDLDRDDWRSFRLDRLTPRVPTGPRFVPREPPEGGWERLVVRGRMRALWHHRARVVVHADAATVAARVPIGSWSVEPRTAGTCWLDAGAQSAALLAVYLGALDLPLTIDPGTAPELHRAARELADRYAAATGSDSSKSSGSTPA
ncbi:helix-turn-helix transcriptional regulator [Actinomycetospora succinea]|uniref:helix-turn-helix transcriptional regulator n=1 Tax=Actinomycetospora succinea TaxID=663603 RepID=UPI0010617611|nr:YafY family protein [Actinomycetospora succinea]